MSDEKTAGDAGDQCCPPADDTDAAEQKRKALLEKYGYKRNAAPAEPDETGACGKTRRRTCC